MHSPFPFIHSYLLYIAILTQANFLITSVRDCPRQPGSPAQDRRARLPRITGLICLPRITGVMNIMIPKPLPKSTRAPTVVVTPTRNSKKTSASTKKTKATPKKTNASTKNTKAITKKTGPPCPTQPKAGAVLSSDPAMIKTRPCSMCKEDTVVPPITRGKECNRVYQRVITTKNSLDPSALQMWDKMSKIKKAELVQNCHTCNFTMDQLRQKMDAVISQEIQTNLAMSLSVSALFMDRAAIANGITANAKASISRLSGDMQNRSCPKTEESHTKTPKLEVLVEDTSANDICQRFCPEQGEQLDEWLNFMRTSGHEVATLEAEILGNNGEWIPRPTKENMAMVRNSNNYLHSLLDALKEAGECDDFSGFIEGMHKFKNEFKTLIAGIKESVNVSKAAHQEIMDRIAR